MDETKHIIGLDMGGNIGKGAIVNPLTGEFVGDLVYINLEGVCNNSEASKRIVEWVKGLCLVSGSLGICAAGNVDENALVIKKSPNSGIKEVITFPRDLKDEGYDVTLSNDMVSAVQDSARFGEGKNLENVCTATYSEGHNAAVVRKRKNVTWAELGHHIYKPDGELVCGCGARGHLEPYVSARGAAVMAIEYFLMTNERNHPIIENMVKRLGIDPKEVSSNFYKIVPQITAKDIYQAYREYPEQKPQEYIRETQVEAIKYSFGLMNSMWNPLDIIVCMGGQTLDKDLLFYGKDGAITKYRLDSEVQLDSLKKPSVVVTERKEIGIRGAVAYYLSKKQERD